MNQSTIALIFPIHNEAGNLERQIRAFWKESANFRDQIREIHLVENGSTDNSLQACRAIATEIGSDLFKIHQLDRGSYGEALKKGIESSNCDISLILEIDAIDLDFIKNSVRAIESHEADFVVASKRHPDSIDQRPLQRRIITALFNLYISWRLNFKGSDTHGLKAIRTPIAKSLNRLCLTTDEVYQTELVLLAEHLQVKTTELPIVLKETRATPIPIFKRLPKVMKLISEVRNSLDRFKKGATLRTVVSL